MSSPNKNRSGTLRNNSNSDILQSNFSDIKSQLVMMESNYKEMSEKLEGVVKCYELFEGFQKTVSMLENNYKETAAKLELVLKSCDAFESLKQSITNLEEDGKRKDQIINNLQYRLNKFEQYTRRDSFEIREVPVLPNESTDKIAIKLAEKLSIQLSHDEITASHRLPARAGKVPAIIVKLQSRRKRDEIVEKMTKGKKVVTKLDLAPLSNNGGRIFVGDSLSPFYKQLLWKCKCKAKEIGYKYVWFRNGEVRIRKAENDPVLKIYDENDPFLLPH